MPVYSPAPVAPVTGRGVWLFEADGTKWLDCIGGIATNALGHCHPRMVAALRDQGERLWHVANGLHIPGQEALAERLTDACFGDLAFFANTGTEAIECAIKVVRRYHAARSSPERIDLIGFHGSFHGRTYAAINASGNAAYLDGFGPRLPGFVHLALEDEAALATAIASPTTGAVIVEPVQGEGGARALSGEFLAALRRLTREHGVLLIYDEVQSGMGRTGRLFAHQWFEGVEPDVMTVAKALGAGFPVAACLATRDAARGMTVGAHGTTFGGNPLAMAVASAAFDEIARPETLAHVNAVSSRIRAGLETVRQEYPDVIDEVRGRGLLVGIRMKGDAKAFAVAARENHLLLAGGGDNCVRMLPSLLISNDEADEAVCRIEKTCALVRQRSASV